MDEINIEIKGPDWRTQRVGHCNAIDDPHCVVTIDWIQKCVFCGFRKWLGLI